MSELLAEDFNRVADIVRVASGRGTVARRGEQLLDPLQQLLHFDAGAVHVFHPQRREFATVAALGYDDMTRKYMQSKEFAEETELVGLHRSQEPMSCQRLPGPRTDLRIWTDYLQPAGLLDGFGIDMFYPNGRHLGLITIHREDRVTAVDALCDRLAMIAPTVADAIDPTRSAALLARTVADADAGVALTRGGTTMSLPGLAPHRIIDDRFTIGARVLEIVGERLADGETWVSFLCPLDPDGEQRGHLRITALACPPESPILIEAVVLVSRPGNLLSLTRRELEVLGLVVAGWPKGRIAATLFITERTVAAHMEHILAKLDVGTRTLAAVHAQRRGLYVPGALSTAPGGG